MNDLLELEPGDGDRFHGWGHAGRGSVMYGGHVAAQAVMAAGHTVDPARRLHGVHLQFLRPGDPRRPVTYDVERLRDGRSYDARRVTARQDDRAILALSASFKSPEPGPSRQPPMPDVTAPEELPDPYPRWREADPADFDGAWQNRVVALRYASEPWTIADRSTGTNHLAVWIRTLAELPDDPLRHCAGLAYASDLAMASAAALDLELPRALRGGFGRTRMASLDHSLWFHRPVAVDEWLLYRLTSPTAADGRGFATGQVWDRQGRMVASLAQELMVRPG